jgi:hypothetical protein
LASHGYEKKEDYRVDAKTAGYMEFDGAVKDADCERVKVSGGVSRELGCCNLFGKTSIKKFSCGTCKFVEKEKK